MEELTATRPFRPEIQKEAVNWWVSCFWVCQVLAGPEEWLPTTRQIWVTCGSSEILYFFFFPQSCLKSNLHLNVRVVGLGIHFQWLTIWRKVHSLSPHFRINIFFFKGAELHHNPSKNSHSATCSEHHLAACLQYRWWASVTGPLCRALTLLIWLWLYHMKEIIR